MRPDPRPASHHPDGGHREFDLVLVGATGFVGRLTAAHLAEAAPERLRIALAGRSRDRLERLRAELPGGAAQWPVLEIDATDPAAAAEVAGRAVALATTVGPYAVRGLPLARACARAGTHYADLTGELLFVHRTVEELHDLALESGARIVHSCGFDSIPSDLGVWLTARQAERDGAGGLTDTELTVRRMRGGFSGGTIDSMRQQMIAYRADARARRVLTDPEALSGPGLAATGAGARAPRTGEAHPAVARRKPRGRGPVRREAGTGQWRVPFVMGGFNAPLVRRSHALAEGGYGTGFRYRELHDVGAGAGGAARAVGTVGGILAVGAGLSFGPTRALLDRFLPAPGDGPTEEQRANGAFTMEIVAGTESGSRYETIVGADQDPGYDGTAVMFGQSALALATGEGSGAGVLTPAIALGPFLVDRLRSRGFTLTTRPLPAG